MNHEKALENQREDKKAFGKFFLFLAVCFVIGGGIGFGCGIMEAEGIKLSITQILASGISAIAPYAPTVLTTIVWIVTAVNYKKCRLLYADWQEEDEETLAKIETRLSYVLWFLSIDMILAYFFMGASIFFAANGDGEKTETIIRLLISVIGIFYTLVICTVYQKKIVNFEKEMNPEKQGSVYDIQFQKKWLASFDEAELMMTYRCAFKAYQIANNACIVLFLFCLFGMFLFGFDLMPLSIVIIFWLILNCSYFAENIRQSKHPNFGN